MLYRTNETLHDFSFHYHVASRTLPSFSDAKAHYQQPYILKAVDVEGKRFTTYGRAVVSLLLQSDPGVRRHVQDLLKSSVKGLSDALVPHFIISWMVECTAHTDWDLPENALVGPQ